MCSPNVPLQLGTALVPAACVTCPWPRRSGLSCAVHVVFRVATSEAKRLDHGVHLCKLLAVHECNECQKTFPSSKREGDPVIAKQFRDQPGLAQRNMGT